MYKSKRIKSTNNNFVNIDNFGQKFDIKYATTRIKEMTEYDIQNLIANQLFKYELNTILPNIHYGVHNHECDLIVVSKTGIVSEIEIKRSISDLKNDSKKLHHKMRETHINYMYYCVPDNIYEKAIEFIPVNCGIIVIRARVDDYFEIFGRGNNINIINDSGIPSGSIYAKIVRNPVKNKFCTGKITKDELEKLIHLAMYRIWPPRINQVDFSVNNKSLTEYSMNQFRSHERMTNFKKKCNDQNSREYKYLLEVVNKNKGK